MPQIKTRFGSVRFTVVGSDEACVEELRVKPRHRGKGHGKRLMRMALKSLGRKIRKVGLVASEGFGTDIKVLLGLYRSLGFKALCKARRDMKDGTREILMIKRRPF